MARIHSKTDVLYPSQLKLWNSNSNENVVLTRPHVRELNSAVAACIVKDGRPFGDFAKSGMVKFLKIAVPGYVAPCRQTVVKMVKTNYLAHQQRLKAVLKKVPKVALTTDLWSSRGMTHYMCITAHFFDNRLEYRSIVIGFRKFLGRHLSDKLKNFIQKELRLLEVPLSKIKSITCDNGADIKKACSSLTTRVPCMAHNLNLVVRNGLRLWPKAKPK